MRLIDEKYTIYQLLYKITKQSYTPESGFQKVELLGPDLTLITYSTSTILEI